MAETLLFIKQIYRYLYILFKVKIQALAIKLTVYIFFVQFLFNYTSVSDLIRMRGRKSVIIFVQHAHRFQIQSK